MTNPGTFVVSWFLLFAGASFLFWNSVDYIRLHQSNEAQLIEQIEAKNSLMQEINYLSNDFRRLTHQHDVDSVELRQLKGIVNLKLKGAAWDPDCRGHALQREHLEKGRLTEDETSLFQLGDMSRDRRGPFRQDEQELRTVGVPGEDKFAPKDLPERRAPVLQVRHTLDGKKEAPVDSDPIARERRDKVRQAMKNIFGSYEKYAWGYDELLPISRRGSNHFGGLGTTIIDSLDTLFVMGLHEQFEKATEWVATNLSFNQHYPASVLDTTKRVLGGLLSSYDLSGNALFLTKAKELADRLSPAWDTPTGNPLRTIELASGRASNPHRTGGSSVLADAGTEQLEFTALSQRTGIRKYEEMAENALWKLKEIYPVNGLLPIVISPHTGRPTSNNIPLSRGDSFDEYLLKAWIQGNKTHVVEHHRAIWEQSMEGLLSLLKESTPSSYWIRVGRNEYSIFYTMPELSCFAPGILALGSEQGGASPAKAAQYLETAEGLARACYDFYMLPRTHLAGRNNQFKDGQDMSVEASYSILRPETIESFFYLWRKTGDKKYRDWGWEIFQEFERHFSKKIPFKTKKTHSRVPTGYVDMRDVNAGGAGEPIQSFFLAETLKYLYLLFSPSSVIPLDEWVFNSGGHPIRIKTRTR